MLAQNLRLAPRKGDLLAGALVLLMAAGLSLGLWAYARTTPDVSVEIYQNGQLVREVSIDSDQEFSLGGDYTNTVRVEGGKIAIVRSTCPGSDCVHSGWVGTAGQAIVCLPNKTEIRLVGTRPHDGIDAIAG